MRKVQAKANAGAGGTGVGVSVGINIAVDNDTRALIADGATIIGGHDVTLSATGSHVVNTVTEGGGKAADGTGVGGSLAITVADNVSEARLGTEGSALFDITGAFKAEAIHHGSSVTTAKGEAEGTDAAVGVAIALSFVDDTARATLDRDVTADGAVSVIASGDGSSEAKGIASAAGGKADDTGTKNADTQTDQAAGLASKQSGETKTVDKSASTEDGDGGGDSVSVGAALGLNIASSVSEARVGAVTIDAGGAFEVRAENNMDASAIGDGSAALGKDTTDGTTVGIGIAINIADMQNLAVVDAGAQITAQSFKAEAVMKDVAGDGSDLSHKFGATRDLWGERWGHGGGGLVCAELLQGQHRSGTWRRLDAARGHGRC